MGIRRTVTGLAATAAARRAAPVAASGAVRQFLARAVDGFAGFPGAREVAAKQLLKTRDVDAALKGVIEQHVRLAGAQGFVTNLGGIALLPVTLPANLAGLAMLQVRMVAAIAHLRGYDIADPSVRTACLVTQLGEQEVREAVRERRLPASPHEIAAGRVPLPAGLLEEVTAMVGQSLVTRVGGKHATLSLARRVPALGGAVSAGVDAFGTYTLGRYADREFPPRTSIERV